MKLTVAGVGAETVVSKGYPCMDNILHMLRENVRVHGQLTDDKHFTQWMDDAGHKEGIGMSFEKV